MDGIYELVLVKGFWYQGTFLNFINSGLCLLIRKGADENDRHVARCISKLLSSIDSCHLTIEHNIH